MEEEEAESAESHDTKGGGLGGEGLITWDSALDCKSSAFTVAMGVRNKCGGEHHLPMVPVYSENVAETTVSLCLQADVEPNNEANRRLYENFICRTEGGAYGSSFEQCTPSIKRRGWLGYRFAAAPTRIRSLPCRPRLCGDQK